MPPRDSERLAQAIGTLLDDESARAAMGVAARERVEDRYSWAAVAAKTAAHYETVLARVRNEDANSQGVTMDSEKGSHAHS
ncbi:Glycosyltransferase [Mycobacteroides abscessus subsp. abscessus]|nr:Glycosyltransferase [Mycobacteroides abscessus subsp. abscessus]